MTRSLSLKEGAQSARERGRTTPSRIPQLHPMGHGRTEFPDGLQRVVRAVLHTDDSHVRRMGQLIRIPKTLVHDLRVKNHPPPQHDHRGREEAQYTGPKTQRARPPSRFS